MSRATGLAGLLCLAGCIGGGADAPTDQVAADVAEWNALVAELEARREIVSEDSVDDATVTGARLVWAEYRSAQPTLHGRQLASGARLDYAIASGVDGHATFRASDELIVTLDLERGGGEIAYRAWAADAPARLVDELVLPAPGNGLRWWAFAVDKQQVYLVREGTRTELLRWRPGGALETVGDLETWGVPVEIFQDFAVAGPVCVIVESGRLWHVNLASGQATWVGNRQEVSGTVSFDARGVLFVSAGGPFWYDLASRELVDVAAAIDASDRWRVNDSFASAHHYAEGATLLGTSVLYVGQDGVFVWNPATDVVEPVVLEPRTAGRRVDYVRPVGGREREVFVVGLESQSGAVGAEGPFYRVRW